MQKKKIVEISNFEKRIANLSQKVILLEAQLKQYDTFKHIYENSRKNSNLNKIKTTLQIEYINHNFNGNYIIATANENVKIFKNDVVINEEGFFIGRVIKVKNEIIKIQLINDNLAYLPVTTSNGVEGFTQRSFNKECELFFIPINDLKPKNGDFVFTSSNGGLIKNRVLIGKIFYQNEKFCIEAPQIQGKLNLAIINNYDDL